jgi:hypothetical protein
MVCFTTCMKAYTFLNDNLMFFSLLESQLLGSVQLTNFGSDKSGNLVESTKHEI